jgi:CelD/BcsL family acetyltransferase involved in cellulose biosynthesis
LMRHHRGLPRQLLGGFNCLPTGRYHTILLLENRDAVFASLLGKKHTRRIRNKLQKAGEVRFRQLQTQQAAGAYLDDFFHHHVRRHAAIGKRSIYATPEACQFIRTLFAKLGPEGRFGVLELDGRPLAWSFGFQVNGKFLLYQHTFDLEASEYTPGELLLWNLFEYARDHVAREFDFGKGDESYKNRFANHSRETFSLFIEPYGWKGRTRGLTRSVQACFLPPLSEIKQIAKSHRVTLRAFRSIRTWMLKVCG